MAKARSKATKKKSSRKATKKTSSRGGASKKRASKKKRSSKKRSSKKRTTKKSASGFGWGGRRPGAGRKPDPNSGVSHRPRPVIRPEDFVLVTMRVDSAYSRVPLKAVDKIVGEAIEVSEKPGFQIESHDVAKGVILLNIRARDRRSLSRGIQGFGIRVTRALNRKRGKAGRAFTDRYDAVTFSSAAERRRMAQTVKAGGRLPHRSVHS